MPFNQFMAFPVELTLHQDDAEFVLQAAPVREIEKLHGESRAWENLPWTKVDGFLANLEADALHIEATITVEDGKRGGLEVRGVPVVYDRGEGTFTCGDHTVPVPGNPESIAMTLLLDLLSLEVFADEGRIYVPMGVNFDADQRGVKTVGEAMFDKIAVHVMQPAWK